MRQVHPTAQILLWIMLVLLAQRSQPALLLAVCLLSCTVALHLDSAQFLRLLRRTRWIALSLLLIYAWATPGKALLNALGSLSPTREGLLDGSLQLGRLLSALAGLAVLLTTLTQARLISGLYTLAFPLRLFGLSRERFAVRLALTLEYAETAMHDTAKDWRSTIAQAMKTAETGTTHIELQRQPYALPDVLLLAAGVVVLAGVWR
jgi:energy-coupling factor transport system permease protein